MDRNPSGIRTTAVALALLAILTACGGSGEQPTPTLSLEEIQTQAVVTFAANLTATAVSLPTQTPTATETPTASPTNTPAITNTASPTSVVDAPTSSCYGMRFVSDVTVPDNTNMSPGQEFTKTWRVRNSGSCAWESGFRLRFTGGEAMGGSAVALGSAVQPGGETSLSVELTAPTTAGTYRGNWRMSTAAGALFGDEVFVQIVVGSATVSATANASATPTPSPTIAPTGTAAETEVPEGN